MKKSELIFNVISVPIDALMLIFASISAFYLRQNPSVIDRPIVYELKLADFLAVSFKILPFVILIFAILGLYNLKGTRRFSDEFKNISIGVSLGLLVIILLFFFDQTIFPSRFIILSTWLLGIMLVVLGRLLLKALQRQLFKKGFGLHRLVLISGPGEKAEFFENYFKNPIYGFKIIREISYTNNTSAEIEKLYNEGGFDEILQADTSLSEETNIKLLEMARGKGLIFSFLPNLFEVQKNSVETGQIGGLPFISIKNSPLDGWGKVVKRAMDIVISLTCLLLTSWLFVLIWTAIKLDSKGKAIYTAMRGGRGKDFKFYKFRTMYSHLSVGDEFGGQEAERIRKQLWQKNSRGGENGPFLKIKDDPRVTRVGKFLRKTKLDEIPQFWNVLEGDMSMVGPRAHVLDEVDKYRNRYFRMFSIKPGIFGLSQIAQLSWPDLPFEEEIRLNTFYIENWSIKNDIGILAKSFWFLFFKNKPEENY